MLTQEELDFFHGYAGFKPIPTANVEDEFTRLVQLRNWKVYSKRYRDAKQACTEASKHSSMTAIPTSTKSSVQTEDPGKTTLEEDLSRLSLSSAIPFASKHSPIPSKHGTMATPEEDFSDDDDGVRIRYFDVFEGFEANNLAPIRSEFGRLASFMKWKKGSEKYREQRLRCFAEELSYFCPASRSNEAVLQGLCVDFGITPVPSGNKKCKKALARYFINIFDYIDSKRAGTPLKPVFRSKEKFRQYTLRGKMFPKMAAKTGSARQFLLETVTAVY